VSPEQHIAIAEAYLEHAHKFNEVMDFNQQRNALLEALVHATIAHAVEAGVPHGPATTAVS
jgi:hypothetical protein